MKSIGVGSKTSTGGEVVEGNPGLMFNGREATSVGQKATCPKCKKGWGYIVAVGPRDVYLPAGPAARAGDYVACGCAEGENELLGEGSVFIGAGYKKSTSDGSIDHSTKGAASFELASNVGDNEGTNSSDIPQRNSNNLKQQGYEKSNPSTAGEELGFHGEPLTRIPSVLHVPAEERIVDRIEEEVINSWDFTFITGKNWRAVLLPGAELPDVRDILSGHPIVDRQSVRGGSPVSLGVEVHVDFHNFKLEIEQFRRVRIRGRVATFRTHYKSLSPEGEVMRFSGDDVVADNTYRTALEGVYFRYKTSTGKRIGTQKWPTPLSRNIPLR